MDDTDSGLEPTPLPEGSSVTITVDGETYGLEPNAGDGYAVNDGQIVWFTALGQEGLLALGLAFYLQSAAPIAVGEYPLGGWGVNPDASFISFIVADGEAGGNTTSSVEEVQVSDGTLEVEALDAETITFAWSGTFARALQEPGASQVPDGSSLLEGHATAVPIVVAP